jgi:uncharacterized protein YcsI (UPF0317 family)
MAVSEPGCWALPSLGQGIDIRSDVPRYRVMRNGRWTAEVTDVRELWREDLVTFVSGCSFSFEKELIEAGIPLRHVASARNVAMYRTNVPTEAAGRFGGPVVVSMRPMSPASAARARAVTSMRPGMHGAPLHEGDPRALGIADLACPDFGDPPCLGEGDIPVFWACGVTAQAALEHARLEFAITHAPGCMLLTDLEPTTGLRIA